MRTRLLRFALVVMVVMTYTAYKASQLWPTEQFLAIWLTIPLFFWMLGGTFLHRANAGLYDRHWFRFFFWTGSLVMGLWAIFVMFSVPVDAIRLAVSFAYPIFSPSDLISQNMSITILCLAGAFSGIGLFGALRGPRIREIDIAIDGLPLALRDLKLVQISDLHIGVTIRKRYVQDVVHRTNALEPDLIFVTGDLVDAKVESIGEHLAPLAQLKARFGVFYVTGNHEYYWGAEDLIVRIRSLGLEPLLNENRIIAIGDTKVLIAGVTDPMGGTLLAGHKPNLKMAAQTSEKPQFKILLAHRPGVCFEAERLGFDLQFSGHTHAGQFFPFSLVIRLAHKYYRGLNRHGGMWLYVNPGTGYWGPANRFAVASEISLIHLKRGRNHG